MPTWITDSRAESDFPAISNYFEDPDVFGYVGLDLESIRPLIEQRPNFAPHVNGRVHGTSLVRTRGALPLTMAGAIISRRREAKRGRTCMERQRLSRCSRSCCWSTFLPMCGDCDRGSTRPSSSFSF